jgi:hypothetical protein
LDPLLIIAIELAATKATREVKAAESKVDSPPSFPEILCCSPSFEDPDKVENSKLLELPTAVSCGRAGERAATPGRDADHCEARDLVLAVACRPTQSVEKAQAAIAMNE